MKLKILYLQIALFMFSGIQVVYSQQIEWVKQNKGPDGNKNTTEISVDKQNGNVYLSGVTFDDDADINTTFDGFEVSASSGKVTTRAFYFAKYNKNGEIQWYA